MPQIQVDEAEFLAGQQIKQVVGQMLKNPKARPLLLKARKEADPNAVIPEIDAPAPLEAKITDLQKQLDDEKKARADEKAKEESEKKVSAFQAEWNRQKEALRARGFTDAAIAEIEKHAETEGIPNLRAAAADWEKLHPPADPVSPSGFGSFNLFEPTEKDDDQMKKLLETRGESESVLNGMIHKTLQEVRGQRRAA